MKNQKIRQIALEIKYLTKRLKYFADYFDVIMDDELLKFIDPYHPIEFDKMKKALERTFLELMKRLIDYESEKQILKEEEENDQTTHDEPL